MLPAERELHEAVNALRLEVDQSIADELSRRVDAAMEEAT